MTGNDDLESLRREDAESAEIIDLMLAESERDLTEFEARRVEAHVERSEALRSYLDGTSPATAGQDHLVRELEVPTPTEDEWRRVDLALFQEIGRATPPATGDRTAPRSPPTSSFPIWKTVASLAATLLLTFLIVRFYSDDSMTRNPSPVDEYMEITEMPTDCDLQIDDVEGFLMIYVTSG